MKLTFLGGTKIVTGAMYLLETNDTKVLIDCGLFQGKREWRKLNYEKFAFNPKNIDYAFITHSHMDHVGRVPKLTADGFSGKVLATKPARELSQIFLLDSAHLQEEEARNLGVKPLYNKEDVNNCMQLFEGVEYDKEIQLSPSVKCKFRNAGHILGSSIIEIWAEDKKIVFTGDLGNPPVPLLKPYDFINEADYVVIESAYGDRNHEEKQERQDVLEDAIEDTVSKGGTLMIPSFAMERTQELLFELNELVENNRIPKIPIFIDSPLAIKATDIYQRFENYFNKETTYTIDSGDDIFNFPGLKMTRTTKESKEINSVQGSKVVIAGSGMSTGGRILFHEKLYLSDPKNMLFIVGYQVKGTLGRKILDGNKEVYILGQRVFVQANVRACGGYSAHADQKKLIDWIDHIKRPVKNVFVVQGEEEPAEALALAVRDKLGIMATAPDLNESVEI